MKKRLVRNRRGMALMIVVAAVAVAAVLGYAMLANSSTQAQISENTASIAQADCLAESGVNYALYCLSYPNNAPAFVSGTWQASNVSLGTSTPGTFSVSIVDQGNSSFSISSTASVSGTNGTAIARHANVSAVANTVFGVANEAGGFVGNISVPANTSLKVTGDLRSTGSATLSASSTVSGTIYQAAGNTVPNSTQITNYQTYKLNGVTYSATLLTTDPAPGTTLGPTSSNPSGVYYSTNRNLTLKGVTINGTILVNNPGGSTANGNLVINTTLANTITPVAGSGLPAVVVANQIKMSGANMQLTVNGLAWVNKGIGTSGTNANLTINGSLLVPVSSTQISSTYNGTIKLNYQADNLHVPDFSPAVQVPTVKVISWTQ